MLTYAIACVVTAAAIAGLHYFINDDAWTLCFLLARLGIAGKPLGLCRVCMSFVYGAPFMFFLNHIFDCGFHWAAAIFAALPVAGLLTLTVTDEP
jgi:hypothetical protein